MLQIRDQQMQRLDQTSDAQFETRMVSHLESSFRWHKHLWCATPTLEIVRFGRSRAANYGLVTERQICIYLTLMPMLGSYFDEDRLLPWAQQVLTDPSIREATIRINRLIDRATAYLDRVLGTNDHNLSNLTRFLLTLRKRLLQFPIEPSARSFHQEADEFLAAVFPQKYQEVGKLTVGEMIREGVDRADTYQLADHEGRLLFIILMFVFGTHIDDDPQLPAFQAILKEDRGGRPEGKSVLLRRLLIDTIDKWTGRSQDAGFNV